MLKIWAVLATILVATSEAGATEDTSISHKTNQFKDFSIQPADMGVLDKPSPRTEFVCRMGDPYTKAYILRRPNRKNCVAVLAIYSNEEMELNPAYLYNYGPIPTLSEISKYQLNELWGELNNINQNSFKLVNDAQEIFTIDVMFEKDRIKKYRVRSAMLSLSPWVILERN